MRYHLFHPIEGESHDPLAALLNNYLRGLVGLEFAAVPHETMRAYSALLAQNVAAGSQEAAGRALLFYQLQVLFNALTGLHQCIVRAEMELADFFQLYQGNFQDFAAGQRLYTIECCSSSEDADWNADDSVRPHTDAMDLAPYTLHAALAPCFAGPATQGEAIGSSAPADFAYFSALVDNPSAFGAPGLQEPAAGQPLQTRWQSEGGHLVLKTPGKRPKRPRHQGLRGETVVQRFNAVLELGQTAAALYAAVGPKDVAGYRQLFDVVAQLRTAGAGRPNPKRRASNQ